MCRILPPIAIALFSLLTLLGCQRSDPGSGSSFAGRKLSVPNTHKGTMPIRVVATTGMVADAVRNIGGDLVRVEQLMGEDVDPHLYKVTSADVTKLNGADVIF